MPKKENDNNDEEELPFRERAAALKRAVDVPVILVGGIRKLATAGEILDSGDADLISMCRPFIREPRLLEHWQKGEDKPSTCISCNKCMPGREDPLHCEDERLSREAAAS